ncbi:MAG: hypothetical protein V7K35_13365 [Nostoc sp.]|uniref:hypothetical protein n=1 Tax=Nostoc sp. TaxID=1180 RepID=UPI002FF4A127
MKNAIALGQRDGECDRVIIMVLYQLSAYSPGFDLSQIWVNLVNFIPSLISKILQCHSQVQGMIIFPALQALEKYLNLQE